MDRRFFVICGMLAPIIFLVSMAIAITIYPDYDVTSNYISDLGVSVVFRIGTAIAGILGIAFSFELSQRLNKFGAAAFLVASIALVGVAVFSSRLDTERIYLGIYRSHYELGHVVSGSIFFITQAIASFLVGFELKKETGYFMILSGLIASLYILVELPLVEHIAIFVFCVSTLLLAVRLSKKYFRIIHYV